MFKPGQSTLSTCKTLHHLFPLSKPSLSADILQQAMMSQQASMMQPRYAMKQDHRRAEYMQQMKEEVNMMNMRPQPTMTPVGQQLMTPGQQIPSNMQQALPANFLQQQQQVRIRFFRRSNIKLNEIYQK